MKKRIVSGIAAVVLTFSGAGTGITNIADLTLDVAAHAEDTSSNEDPEEPLPTSGTCGENLTWTVDEEGTLTISGTGEMYDYSKDDSPTWRYLDIKKAVIEDSVTTIGAGAFYLCNGITSVTIPKSVTSIGEFALGYYDEGNPEPGYEIKVENFKISCYKGTAGEQYAIDNGFDYELLDETPANPAPTATPGDNCVTLDWEAAENAEKYAVAVEVDGKWTLVEKTTDTSYVLKHLNEDTEYKVAVIAMFGGKWKVQARTDKTEFTSPKLKAGSTVEMVICAKVNGKWDTGDLDSRAFVVTV